MTIAARRNRGWPHDLVGACLGGGARAKPEQPAQHVTQVVEQGVGDGRREQRQQQGQELPDDDGTGGGAVEFGADAVRRHQRKHAGDERERRHQDRPQSVAVAVHGQDVERRLQDNQRHQGERHRQRQRQQDRDRVQPRLELGRQDQVHEEEGQAEGEKKRQPGPFDLLRLSERPEGVLRRQLHILDRLLERRADLARADTGRGVGQEYHAPLAGEALDLGRTLGLLQIDDVEQRYGAELRRGDGQLTERLLAGARGDVGPHQNVVIAAALLIARHLDAADQQLRRQRDVQHVDAEIGGLAAVDRGDQLRVSGHERRVDVDGAGHGLQLRDDLVGVLDELFVGAVQDVLDRGGAERPRAERGHHRHAGAVVLGQLGHDLVAHPVLQLVLGDLARVGRNEADEDRHEVRRLLLVVADGRHGRRHLRPLTDLARDALAGDLRRRQAGSLGQAHVDLELRLVVLGKEGFGDALDQRDYRDERDESGNSDQPAAIEEEREQTFPPDARLPEATAPAALPQQEPEHRQVDALDRLVERVGETFERRLAPPARGRQPQQARCQHRRQREADQQRDGDGGAHGQAEAAQEPPRDRRHEGDGQEHRQQRQRRRQHRQADLARRVDRRRHRPHALLFDEPEDVLEHNDRVVDDDADRQRQRQQRDGVDGEAHPPHAHERADDRGRDRDRRDERAAQAAEEQEHDQRRQDGAEAQVLLHRADAGPRRLGVVADDRQTEARRHPRLELLHALVERVHDRDAVLARLLADRQHHGRLAVDAGGGLSLLFAIDHRAEIGDRDRVALDRAHDDLADRGDRRHAAAHPERQPRRTGVDRPARRRHVLGDDGALDLDRAHPRAAQLHGIQNHLNLALPPTQDGHLPDARHVLQRLPQLVIGELRHLADRALRQQRDEQHRRRVRIQLADDRVLGPLGQIRQRRRHLVTHLLSREVDVLVEVEPDDQLRHALGGDRLQLLETADRVDRLFDLVRHLGLDLLRGGARQHGHDRHDRKVDVGKAIEVQLEVADHADDGDGQHQYRREDGPLDANAG